MLHLHDTAAGTLRPVGGRVPGELSLYLCGPTVYGEPHLGHGRMTVTWDVLVRYVEWSGTAVRLVSNVTDIDDKIIARAAESGTSAEEVARTQEDLWWATMDRLGVRRPDEVPHATAWVGEMVELIGDLVGRGSAYVGGDGVYFSAASVEDYGLLARQPLESLRAGARVEVGEEAGKREAVDFVLWKFAKPGEPSWPSPWGPGRPGWHTECVVMSLGLLGDGFDLHGGGNDLAFPHHENERAQAVAAGRHFARAWAHSGMVVAEGGEKMSKSLGNTTSLPELVERFDPRALRLLVLNTHYRSPMTISEATMAASAEALRGLDTFAADFAWARGAGLDAAAVDRFREVMDDDLRTPAARALLFELARDARAALAAGDRDRAAALAATTLELAGSALGLPLGRPEEEVPADVQALADERATARAARDWARSDALRADLQALGWVVEDTPAGSVLHR